MSCERFAQAISDCACGAEMTPALVRHLAGCAGCGARLNAGRRAVAALDLQLQQALDVPVSPSFARNVTARLEEDSRRRSRWLVWSVAPAAAALLLALWLRPSAAPTVEPLKAPAVETSVRNLVLDTQPVPMGPAVIDPAPKRASRQSRHPERTESPEVIVQPEQARALAELVKLARRGALDATALQASTAGSPSQDLVLAPLNVPDLVVPDVEFAQSPPTAGPGSY